MKAKVIKRAGKGSQAFLPSKSAVNDLVRKRSSVVGYAKAGPDVVRSGARITERKP